MSIRVRAVIIRDDELVALERHKDDSHFWCFPGGGVEEGENEKEALIRECLEEINIQVKVGEKIWEQDFHGDIIKFYLCQIISGEVGKGNGPEYENNDTGDIHEPVWLPMIDLRKYDLKPNDLRDKLIRNRM